MALGKLLYSMEGIHFLARSSVIYGMPQFTESRIEELSAEALAVKTEPEIEQTLNELRSALHEHIELAKESLGAQVVTISALEAKKS